MTGTAPARVADGYAVVLCTAPPCRAELSTETAEVLRECVRTSRHGVLVVSGCVSGGVSCRLRPPGQMLLVQPCDADRTPQGAAVRVGPVRTSQDLAAVRASLHAGHFDPSLLPSRLLVLDRRARAAAHN